MKWLTEDDIADVLIVDMKFKLHKNDCWATKFDQVAAILNKKMKHDVKTKIEEFVREL